MGRIGVCMPRGRSAMSPGHRKVKQSVYLPEEMLESLRDEAARLERPLSWLLHRAWRIASPQIASLPDA